MRKLVFCILILTVACTPVTPSTTPTPQPEPTFTNVPNNTPAPTVEQKEIETQPHLLVHPPETRSGIDAVDRVIEAVLSGEQSKVNQMVSFTLTGCTHAEGLGGPPKCLDVEDEGTLVQVLPFLGSEGSFLRIEEMSLWTLNEIDGLYAVYVVSPDAYDDPNYPAGDYGVVFRGMEGMFYVTFRVTDAGIVRVGYDFTPSPGESILHDAAEVIITPP